MMKERLLATGYKGGFCAYLADINRLGRYLTTTTTAAGFVSA
jgi:hypothetical protein